jgi:hypothetical protein
VTGNGGAAFSRTVGQQKSKKNGNQTGAQCDLEYQACRLSQGWPPHPQNLEHRQEHNQSDGKMHQQRMEAAKKLKPIRMGSSV